MLAQSLLNAVFIIIGGYVAISYLLPMLRDFFSGILKEEKSLDGLMGIINLYIIIFILAAIVTELMAINNQYLNYFGILTPGLNVLVALIPYIQWLVVGVLVVLGLKNLKK